MNELHRNQNDKKEILKNLIKRLHEGVNPEEVKKEFKEAVGDITPISIAQAEEELVNEGVPVEEVHRLCDVHLAIFRDSLEKETPLAPAGHPIHILMEEHKTLLGFLDELTSLSRRIDEAKVVDPESKDMKRLSDIVGQFKGSESHYLREENVLFPYLEKHGITQPPAIMWTEHNKIRDIEKNLYRLVDTNIKIVYEEFAKQLVAVVTSMTDMLSSHYYKENNVLFPTSLKVVEEKEWIDIRQQFDELGYCPFTPEPARIKFKEMTGPPFRPETKNMISFETGSLSNEEIEAIFDTLPAEVTFIDRDDKLRYFSQSKEMIFVRTKAAIGLKVQQCHPQKSLHVVNKILEDFKIGRRDVAKFWINFKGKLVYIRYYPVRNKNGDYLGCLEVTQDVSDIKKLEGERRLLDTT